MTTPLTTPQQRSGAQGGAEMIIRIILILQEAGDHAGYAKMDRPTGRCLWSE